LVAKPKENILKERQEIRCASRYIFIRCHGSLEGGNQNFEAVIKKTVS
jgi:hypothetical protein